MDLIKLSRMLNSTAASGNLSQPLNLAPTILEAFIPGYSLISRFISHALGFDVGIVVSTGMLFFAFGTAWKYISKTFWSLLNDYCVSAVYFDDHDELFQSVLDWIAEQRVVKTARRLKAVSKQGSSPEEDDVNQPDGVEKAELFHFGKWAAKVPPKYEPSFGSYVFMFGLRVFIFERGRREKQATSWQGRTEEEHITLKTLGWTTTPIKDLLTHIKHWSIERENSITVIKRPQSKESRRYQGAWSRVTSRPSRPMETVVLDPEQKQTLVDDVNEYLSPASPKWYAVRGIPYRRGYLFHGPPGTGKSSLSFALAGLFGLNIFVISLLEPTLTEGDLAMLFNNLPKRCIVLLEDIDTAGLSRADKSDEAESNPSSKEESKDDKISVADLAKELKKGGRRGAITSGDEIKQGISLSGLLNAIDGVASHEGRVLVMTTNHPEKLDAALIRPGRVDMQVAFTLATKHQVREIFSRMYYSIDQPINPAITLSDTKTQLANGTLRNRHAKHYSNGHVNGSAEPLLKPATTRHQYSKKEIEALAEAFAGLVPEGKFSPAEVQNFLITRKKDPQRAMDEVENWRDELLKAKEMMLKVVTVR